MNDDVIPETDCPDGNCPTPSKKSKKNAKKMDCDQLLDKINELTDSEKRGWEGGTKGLLQRFRDYKGDDNTHGAEIFNQQRSLKAYLDEYKNQGCGPPPPLAMDLLEKKVEAPQPAISGGDVANAAGKTALTLGAGYLIYRGVRMLPSLFPPLWPTIPANVAIP